MAQQATFASSLLVVGPEGLIAERTVADRIAAARRAQPQAEVSRIDAVDLEGNRFAELTGGSLFSSHNIVVIEDISAMPSELFDVVVATAAKPSDELCLTLLHPGGQKGKGLVDKLTKAKVPKLEAKAPKPWEVPKFVIGEGKRAGVQIDAPAAQSLVDAVGTDLRTLAGAVSQLASDNDGQPITATLVARYFGGRADVTSFAVVDDVMAGRQGEALQKLRWALGTGVAPVLVTSALAGQLRSLGKYFEVRSTRMPEGEMARACGVPPWKVKDLSNLSRSWSPAGVSEAIRAVAVADARVKGAATDPDFALEQVLLAVDRAHRRGR